MNSSPSPSAITGVTSLIIIFILTLPSVTRNFEFFSHAKDVKIGRVYEDEDGSATEETQKEYSTTAPKFIALSSSAAGFIASIVSAVFTSAHSIRNLYVENWLVFGSWV